MDNTEFNSSAEFSDDHLTPEQFHICREKGTEAPFSGEHCDYKGNGIFVCVCCNA